MFLAHEVTPSDVQPVIEINDWRNPRSNVLGIHLISSGACLVALGTGPAFGTPARTRRAFMTVPTIFAFHEMTGRLAIRTGPFPRAHGFVCCGACKTRAPFHTVMFLLKLVTCRPGKPFRTMGCFTFRQRIGCLAIRTTPSPCTRSRVLWCMLGPRTLPHSVGSSQTRHMSARKTLPHSGVLHLSRFRMSVPCDPPRNAVHRRLYPHVPTQGVPT